MSLRKVLSTYGVLVSYSLTLAHHCVGRSLTHTQTQLFKAACVCTQTKTVSDSSKRSKIRFEKTPSLESAAQTCSLEAVYWQFGTTPSSGAAAHSSLYWHSAPLLALSQGKLPH
jgi:hypothetical protein